MVDLCFDLKVTGEETCFPNTRKTSVQSDRRQIRRPLVSFWVSPVLVCCFSATKLQSCCPNHTYLKMLAWCNSTATVQYGYFNVLAKRSAFFELFGRRESVIRQAFPEDVSSFQKMKTALQTRSVYERRVSLRLSPRQRVNPNKTQIRHSWVNA